MLCLIVMLIFTTLRCGCEVWEVNHSQRIVEDSMVWFASVRGCCWLDMKPERIVQHMPLGWDVAAPHEHKVPEHLEISRYAARNW